MKEQNKYSVELDGEIIGTTNLEKADAPMGVVTGVIDFVSEDIGYDFIKSYCTRNQVELTLDLPDQKAIGTMIFPNLAVKTSSGKEIKGIGTLIEGIDKEYYEVTVLGYPYPEYELEFPHHVKQYFGDTK